MTREEAIVILKCVMPDSSIRLAARDEEIKEAMNMAIKALEQEPCEDCISRAQAQTELEINACRYTLAKERGDTGKVEWDSHLIDVIDAVNVIRNLPPVTVLPTRKWIPVSERLPKKVVNT